MRLKNEFETAMVNQSSVFEPLKVCCTCHVANHIFALQNSCSIHVYYILISDKPFGLHVFWPFDTESRIHP